MMTYSCIACFTATQHKDSVKKKSWRKTEPKKKKNHKYRTLHKLWKAKARAAKLQSGQVLEKERPGPQLSKIKLVSHPSKYFRISVLK